MVGGRSYLFQPPRRAVGPSGINPSFLGLSRYQGWVTHVLLTRSPLSPGPKAWFSLDLHVLSAPPAFVLSQDQTLREDMDCRHSEEAGRPFTSSFSCLLKGHPVRTNHTGRRGIDNWLNAAFDGSVGPGLDTRRTFAVEFSKTGARLIDGVKKPPTRARGLRGNESYRIRIGPGRLLGRGFQDSPTPPFRTAEEV